MNDRLWVVWTRESCLSLLPIVTAKLPLAYHSGARRYAKGGHAFGMRQTGDPITREWPEQVKQWLHDIGML